MAEPVDQENQNEDTEADRYVADLYKRSMTDDISVQIGNINILFIQGKAYEEKVGRIIQLKALNEGKVEVAGISYLILAANKSKDRPMAYDFCLVRADSSGETLNLLVDYGTVRKMVERKTPAFDPSVVDDLLERLNDMHEDAFTINGQEYYIAGEEWTQTTPGCRVLILIPVGRTDSRNVTMSVPEALIEEMIKTRLTSIRVPQQG